MTRTRSWNPIEYYNDDTPYTYQLPFQSPINNIIESTKSDHNYECNCIKLRDCPSIMNALYSARNPDIFSKEIKKFECGYNGFLVCCPPSKVKSKAYRHVVMPEEPWVWDVEESKDPAQPTPNSLSRRHNFDEFNHFYKPNDVHQCHLDVTKLASEKKSKKKIYFDFEDPKTFRNCPPSFSHDFDMPLHFQNIGTNNMIAKPSTFPKRHYEKLMNSQNCGISINPRIIGGDDAAPNQFPWYDDYYYYLSTVFRLHFIFFSSFSFSNFAVALRMARLAYRNRCKIFTIYQFMIENRNIIFSSFLIIVHPKSVSISIVPMFRHIHWTSNRVDGSPLRYKFS